GCPARRSRLAVGVVEPVPPCGRAKGARARRGATSSTLVRAVRGRMSVLDAIHPWGRPLRPALARQFAAQVAVEGWQLRGYWRLRRAVFAEEQGIFQGSDEDEHDRHALPIVAVS